MGEREPQRRGELVARRDPRMPTLDPSEAGFTNTGQPSAWPTRGSAGSSGSSRPSRSVSDGATAIPAPRSTFLQRVLVHRDRRPEDAGADVRQPDRLEQALHRSVLAERAVQRGNTTSMPGERRRPRHRPASRAQPCPAGAPPEASTSSRRERRARRCCRAAARSRPRRSRPEARRSARDRARPRTDRADAKRDLALDERPPASTTTRSRSLTGDRRGRYGRVDRRRVCRRRVRRRRRVAADPDDHREPGGPSSRRSARSSAPTPSCAGSLTGVGDGVRGTEARRLDVLRGLVGRLADHVRASTPSECRSRRGD